MSLKMIVCTCLWCETKQHFDGEDPEAEAREAGWFQVTEFEDYEPLDFCSIDCMISWMPGP